MTDESDGFLSRWSRRKVQLRQGVPAAEPTPVVQAPAPARAEPVVAAPEPVVEPTQAQTPPPPTLADVEELTPTSDYTRFVTRDVDPTVKNAALKKLFADPQFNVMDGLDTYIDDYGKPDPLPEGMLRKMAQAKFLGLFTDEDDDAAQAAPPLSPTESNEDTDLRLQPHDAAGRAGPEPGAEPHGGGEH